MSYEEPESNNLMNNPRLLTAIIVGAIGLVSIVGCVAIFFIFGSRNQPPTQGTKVIQVTKIPTSTATLTVVPSTKQSTLDPNKAAGGGGETPTPDLTATFINRPQTRAATLSEIAGSVQIKSPIGGDFTTVTTNVTIPAGTIILTSENSSVKITLTEGTIIRIGSQTQVKIEQLGGTTQNPVTKLKLDFGKVWSIVGGSLGTGSFDVETPLGVASVVGSFMGNESNPTEELDIITCLEGKCKYSNAKGVQSLTTLQQLIVKKDTALGAPTKMDVVQVNDWSPTKVSEVVTLTPTSTPTSTSTGTRTPTNTPTPSNTPLPTNTPNATSTLAQATANQQATNNAGTSTSQAQVNNLTSTVFFFNVTSTALAQSTQNSFTATSFSFTATSFAATSNANATNSVLTATAALTQTAGVNATNSQNLVNATNTQAAANLTGTAVATQTQIAGTNAAATSTRAAAATATAAVPVIQFSPLSYSVYESAGTVPITVTMSQPVTCGNVVVNYSTTPSTAANPADYAGPVAPATASITFNPNDISKSINLTIVDGGTDELNETFQVTLETVTPPGCASPTPILGSNKISTVTIVSSSQPTVGFSSSSYSVTEGNSSTTTATITVTLSRAYANTTTVGVNYSTITGGTATSGSCGTAGVDYQAISSTPLSFAPAETSKTFTVTVCGDALNETDETVFLSLASPSNASLGVATATLTITNDDAVPTITISSVSPSTTVTEPADPPSVTPVTYTIHISAASGQNVTVNYATGGGTATAGSDYTSASGTLTWLAGDSADKSVVVNVNADFVYEPTETFNFTLSSPTNATVTGTNPQTINITNDSTDTAPSAGFSASPYTVNEPVSGTTPKTITVNLDKPSGETIKLAYTTTSGATTSCTANFATADSDYASASGQLVFTAGDISKNFDVTINSDAVTEAGGECLTLQLTLQSGTSTSTFPVKVALWIYDP